MTRPREMAVDSELFNFLSGSAQEYVDKLKQVGAAPPEYLGAALAWAGLAFSMSCTLQTACTQA